MSAWAYAWHLGILHGAACASMSQVLPSPVQSACHLPRVPSSRAIWQTASNRSRARNLMLATFVLVLAAAGSYNMTSFERVGAISRRLNACTSTPEYAVSLHQRALRNSCRYGEKCHHLFISMEARYLLFRNAVTCPE